MAKKTKRVVGKCFICGYVVKQHDLVRQKRKTEPKVVKLVVGWEERMVCLSHQGVEELLEPKEDKKDSIPTS